jgi:hypothetical protein
MRPSGRATVAGRSKDMKKSKAETAETRPRIVEIASKAFFKAG